MGDGACPPATGDPKIRPVFDGRIKTSFSDKNRIIIFNGHWREAKFTFSEMYPPIMPAQANIGQYLLQKRSLFTGHGSSALTDRTKTGDTLKVFTLLLFFLDPLDNSLFQYCILLLHHKL